MRKILFLILFSLSLEAQSLNFDDSAITINLTSKHIIKNTDYNENNFGLGFAYKISEKKNLEIGYYKNSQSDKSWFIFTKHKFNNWVNKEQFKIYPIIVYGLITGYDEVNLNRAYPIVLPGIDFNIFQHHNLNLLIAPLKSKGNTGVVIGAQYQYWF